MLILQNLQLNQPSPPPIQPPPNPPTTLPIPEDPLDMDIPDVDIPDDVLSEVWESLTNSSHPMESPVPSLTPTTPTPLSPDRTSCTYPYYMSPFGHQALPSHPPLWNAKWDKNPNINECKLLHGLVKIRQRTRHRLLQRTLL